MDWCVRWSDGIGLKGDREKREMKSKGKFLDSKTRKLVKQKETRQSSKSQPISPVAKYRDTYNIRACNKA